MTPDNGAVVLVLTRRVGESLLIGSQVTVTVVGVKGNQIRIGVNAPRSIPVYREELYERVRRERPRLGEPRTPLLPPLERSLRREIKSPSGAKRCDPAYSEGKVEA
jgi:carbon storage regulator